ncbi:sulfite oxidase [Halobacteriales archaeon SW_5_70_135]|nr:MAG: sulfite oxidase [Halobacteriales archaeon SW_5_70_135]
MWSDRDGRVARISTPLPPRLVDWTVLGAVVVAVGSGVTSLVAGRPGDWWVFAVHGVAGFVLLVALFWKLRRVRPRVTEASWTRTTVVSMVLTALALGAVGTGVAWTFGANVDLALWNLLNLHVLLGLLVGPVLLVHLRSRFRWPARADFEGRRTALVYSGLAVVGVGAWALQRAVNRLTGLAGERRFTGSRDRGRFAGNAFPVTSWMADDPDPVDAEAWELRVVGAVAEPYAADYGTVSDYDDRLDATLDCTSGWYARSEWAGVRVGRLLEAADVADDARYVSFRSVTGYRWALPVEEARDALLATRVDGERLSDGHGFPLRLVAPGRRGFQWVKWVETVEVRRDPDPGQLAAIFLSWL